MSIDKATINYEISSLGFFKSHFKNDGEIFD